MYDYSIEALREVKEVYYCTVHTLYVNSNTT